jgi:hypothetical protein
VYGTGDGGPPHALRVGRGDPDGPQVVQHVLGTHGPGPDPVAGHGGVAGEVGPEAVDGDDHPVVLGDRVAAEGERRVGGGTDDVRDAGRLQHVGHMTAAAALDAEGVDRAAFEHAQGVLDRQALVQPLAVQGDLDVVLLGDPQGGVQGSGVGAHVLVHLEAAGASLGEGLGQRRLAGGRTAPQETDVDRPGVEGVEGVAQGPRRVDADARAASIASAGLRPSLAASQTVSAIRTVASGTLSRRPRARRALASSAAPKSSSRSRSVGVGRTSTPPDSSSTPTRF